MEYRLLKEQDIKLMKEIVEDDEMLYSEEKLYGFINDKNNYGFIALEDNKVVGFIYCYSLLKPDGRYMCYVHSVGVLSSYQGKGIGSKLFEYMVNYLEKENRNYKYFLLTSEDNVVAQKLYDKYSDKKCIQVYYQKTF